MQKMHILPVIAKLERRMDSAEGDIKQIKGGVAYLVHVDFLSFDANIIAYYAHRMVKISLRLDTIGRVAF